MKKILRIFRKDVKIATRDSMLMYIIIIPLVLAVGLNLFTPGLNDTTFRIAMLDTDTIEHIQFMEEYAKVELFNSVEEVERRVNKRDDISAILPLSGGGYEILTQGNESESIQEFAKALNTFYELGLSKENTTAEAFSFNKTAAPLKAKLANMLILLVVMLAGMIVSLGIVEEKADNTINAINVTPVSQNRFIVGKTMLGGFTALSSIIASLLILGYYDINWFMIVSVGITSMILSGIIGFLQGLSSTDVIEAAAGVKMLMLPIAGSIAGFEFLAAKWQWTMYWSPFYWAYKANDMILTKVADWPSVLLYTGLVFGLSMVVFVISIPKIRKGLS